MNRMRLVVSPLATLACLGAMLPPPSLAADRGPEFGPAPEAALAPAAQSASLEDIQRKVDELQAKADDLAAQAKSQGLDPATAGPEEVRAFLDKQALAFARTQLGLGGNATWQDVFGPQGKEAFRKTAAQRLGLPADAPWSDVVYGLSELARQGAAKGLGLDAKAAWSDIATAAQKKGAGLLDALAPSPKGKAAHNSAAGKPKLPKLKRLPPLSQ